jgi:beta-mannosidase
VAIRKRLLTEWTLSYLDESYPATVPGTVHTDLMAQGLLRDIRIDGTEAEMEWIGNTDFTYQTSVTELPNGQSLLLFHGLDTLADIYIDGELKLSTKNMHRSYEIDLSEVTAPFDVEVRFHAPLPEMVRLEKERGPLPNPYNRPYNIIRKMACSFGWDWGPITLTSGIWKPVELITYQEDRIIDVQVIADYREEGILHVTPHAVGSDLLFLSINGRNYSLIPNQLNELVIPDFNPWNPRGYGEQNLYEITISGESDTWSARVGFRHIELHDSLSQGRREFAPAINGQRIALKGVNWIPDDPFPSRISRDQYKAKLENLLELGVNAIRVWGGGIYESDLFYQLCDEMGFLVWQDFLFACAAYSEDPETMAEVEAEARENIARLSKYASLFMWCGNNECLEGHQNWGWLDELQGRPWGATYYFDLLPKLVAELDPSRIYIPGSPFAVDSDDVMSELSGTNHIWDVWNRRKYQGYETYTPSLAAEFGYNGPGSWQTLTRSLVNKEISPNNSELVIHQKAFKGMENIENGLAWEFANPPQEGTLWYFAAQLVQARAVETGVKHFRTLYPICSGTFLWQFNDMWPALSWAVFDSDSQRKLAWYSLRSAYQPIVLHFDGPVRTLKILNEGPARTEKLHLRQVDANGLVLSEAIESIALPEGGVYQRALDFSLTAGTYLIADCAGIRTTRYALDEPIPALSEADFSVETSQTELNVQFTVTANNLIVDLSMLTELLAKDLIVDKQRHTLMPGESCVFLVSAPSREVAEMLKAADSRTLFYSQNSLR